MEFYRGASYGLPLVALLWGAIFWASGCLPHEAEAQTTTTVQLTWGAPTGGGPPDGYTVQRKCGSVTTFTDVPPNTTAAVRTWSTPQVENLICSYHVLAFNTAGKSPPSNVVIINTWTVPGAPTNLQQTASTALKSAYPAVATLEARARRTGDRKTIGWAVNAKERTTDAIALSSRVEAVVGP